MNATQYIQNAVNGMHQAMLNDGRGVTASQAAWKPAPMTNPISFLVWHTARVEDQVVSGLQRKPSVWEEGKWYEKMGLDAKAYGTGFQEPDVDRVASHPFDQIVAYAEAVFGATGAFLETLSDDRLDFVPNPQRPGSSISVMLSNIVIGHGWSHLGEIRFVKGMQGISQPH